MLISLLRRHGLAVGLSVLILFKVWLVHAEDIYASATEYDALWYVGSAKNWYWGTPFSWTAFARPPAYPLFIALVHLTGIPLRLGIELLQLTAYLLIIHALRKVAVPNRVCLLAFAAMALHPASLQFNNYTMSDCFYAAILPLCVGGLLLLLFTARLKHALWTGAALAVLWNTREESFLIAVMLALFVALGLWLRRRQIGSWKQAAFFWLKPFSAMVAVLAALVVAVNTANYRAFGSFAKSDMVSAPYKAAYNALLRIKPDRLEHYVGISTNALEKAYAVSPTFARLRPQFEGDLGRAWQVPATAALGHPEFGAWFMWGFRSVAANTDSIYASADSANEFYRRVAREINQACDNRRLACRPVLLSFLDPGAFSFLHYLPESMIRTAKLFARPHQKIYEREDSIITPAQRDLYDEMTGRRPGPPTPQDATRLTSSDKLSIATENFIGNWYWLLVTALAAGAFIGPIAAAFSRELTLAEPLNAALVFIGTTILIRFFFFSFFDATYWADDYERYLFPVMPLTSGFFTLVIWRAIRVWRTRHRLPTVG
jgi:hypothetical protein